MGRFSIKSLIVAATIFAVCCSAWNQNRQSSEIAELKERLAFVEKDARLRARINDLFAYFDSNDDERIEIFDLLQRLVPRSHNPSLPREFQYVNLRSATIIADVDGQPGGLEMMSLSNVMIRVPGMSYSVNVLFDDDRIVDVLVRRTGTRTETHSVEMVDINGDNQLELVLNCQPEFLSRESPSKLIYSATATGFEPTHLE
jgi:hypothetical protein